jgi:hypothetical protein
MKKHRYFGEEVEGYEIPVLNEREARAGAGILLLPAIYSFLNSYMTHNFYFTKIFVTIFMIDFIIRVLINPKYAPTLILGRLFVQNQIPEYVGAKQKKFAWSIGLVLSIVMFFIIVVFEIMTPIKIVICLLCISLLFSETAFGICLGCIIYHKIQANKPQYCPGGVCEIKTKEKIQQISPTQYTILTLAIVTLVTTFFMTSTPNDASNSTEINKSGKCASGKCSSGKCGV